MLQGGAGERSKKRGKIVSSLLELQEFSFIVSFFGTEASAERRAEAPRVTAGGFFYQL